MSPKQQPRQRVTEIRLSIEGGGKGDSTGALRRGFRALLAPLRSQARSKGILLEPVMGGNTQETHKHFEVERRTHKKEPGVRCMLLVDADTKPSDLEKPWEHAREQHHLDRGEAADCDCHLMVMTMESWLLCDPEAIAKYYGINQKALPPISQVEQMEGVQQIAALERATRDTTKGKYHKVRHAEDLLGKVDPEKLRKHSKSFKRFVQTLEDWIAAVP